MSTEDLAGTSPETAPLVEPPSPPTAVFDVADTFPMPLGTHTKAQDRVVEPEEDAPENAPVPAGRWNILSIVSLLLALTLSPLTVIFGYLAIGQIRRSRQRGEAVAWFAVAVGWLWLIAYLVLGTVAAITWFQLR
jgi:uncharacterized membrane protein